MRPSLTVRVSLGVAVGLGLSTIAFAAVFPDVPDDHVYRDPIEHLVGLKVINGNPDGRFYPERSVNRAEMLTLLYRALGLTPEATGEKCFSDVVVGSWYEAVVCDAAAHRYVEGYSDGRFRPEKEVNRVEALKMIMNMFSIPVSEITTDNRGVIKFVDVSLSAWYTKYLYAAFTNGILPIAGQIGPRFYPDAPLLRGEAAAYIDNALPLLSQQGEPGESSLGDDAPSSSAPPKQASSAALTAIIKNKTFPFTDSDTFTERLPVSIRFSLKETTTVDMRLIISDVAGTVTCRLFKLKNDGLSAEYYFGTQKNETCWMRVALAAGDYQFDMQPSAPNVGYDLTAKAGKSDGNDGFIEAKILQKGVPRSAVMLVDGYADWYRFVFTSPTRAKLQVSSAEKLKTIIYPMDDVDLYGFSGPVNNVTYDYPAGTYYVGIMRGDPLLGKVSYTVELK